MKLEFTSEFLDVVVEFRSAFSKRSWPYMLGIALPWLLQQGQRSVRNLTHGAGLAVHESNFYRFFSEFKFNTELFSRILFDRIVAVFKLSEILLVVDDTLCPKWGRRIFGTASFFDHVARPRPGFIWGHNWVVLAVIVDLFGAPVAIPFWVKLYRSQSSCPPKEFRTRLQITEEAIRRVVAGRIRGHSATQGNARDAESEPGSGIPEVRSRVIPRPQRSFLRLNLGGILEHRSGRSCYSSGHESGPPAAYLGLPPRVPSCRDPSQCGS